MRTTTALDATKVTTGTLPEARITSLDSTKLTGTIANARISEASVVQHSPPVDLSSVQNDIAVLALHYAVNENKSAYGLVNSWIDQFENSTYITGLSSCSRVVPTGAKEYIATAYSIPGSFANDSDTGFLLHSDTTNGSTTFTDSSSNTHTIGIRGTSPVHSTAKSKLGASSILLSGSNGLNVATHSSLVYAGDFTWEYWIWTANSGSGSRVVGIQQAHGNQMYTRHKSDSGSYGLAQVLMTGESNSAGEAFGSHNLTPEMSAISDWVHIAICRQGNVIRGYIGGVQKVTWTKAAINTSPAGLLAIGYCPLCSGGGGGEFVPANTYLDEIRFSGVCRYLDGTTFTPRADQIGDDATGSFVSTGIPAATVNKSKVGIVVLYKENQGTNHISGSKLIAKVRANTSDTNYNAVTLVEKGTFSTGVKIAVGAPITVTAGQALGYKIEFAGQAAGSLETRVLGVALTY